MATQRSSHAQRPILGVSVVARRDARVLLVRRGQPPFVGAWALPGGKVEFGERLAEAAAREVREETGLTVDRLEQIDVAEIVERDQAGVLRSHHVVVVFAGEVGPEVPAAGDDAAAVTWATAAERRAMTLTEDTRRVLSRFAAE